MLCRVKVGDLLSRKFGYCFFSTAVCLHYLQRRAKFVRKHEGVDEVRGEKKRRRNRTGRGSRTWEDIAAHLPTALRLKSIMNSWTESRVR